MFATLKNKIINETGKDPVSQIRPSRQLVTPTNNSLSTDEHSSVTEKETEIQNLKLQVKKYKILFENLEIEKRSLEETCKRNKMHKEMFDNESETIQNSQDREITKLKTLLNFREQESIDQMNRTRADQQTIEHLRNETSRIDSIGRQYEHIKDEMENLRRSSQLERNQLQVQLSAKEEEIRHLSSRLEISEQFRNNRILSLTDAGSDKVTLLLQERKILENRLEEAHLHLYDIKSSWTSQNLTLENQLHRLSKQVAEETAEKRKAFDAKESLCEKIRLLEKDIIKARDELQQRDNKITLLTEEIEELNASLRDLRLENEEEIEFLRSKVAYQENELTQVNNINSKSNDLSRKLEQQFMQMQEDNIEMKKQLSVEIDKNVLLKAETIELEKTHFIDLGKKNATIKGLQVHNDKLENEVVDRTKAVKTLNQRLFDVKKTLHEEIRANNKSIIGSIDRDEQQAEIITLNGDNILQNNGPSGKIYDLDEVKFSYLKHVILKFLTTEEKHLIRAVSTLLFLNDSEEKLLAETLEYRRSWFGVKPDVSFL